MRLGLLIMLGCAPPVPGDTGGPALLAEPTVLDFGTQDYGSPSVAPVTLWNAGTGPLEVDLWLSAASFHLVETPPRPLRLQPGDSWTVTIQFTPTRRLHDAQLEAHTATTPGLLRVPITGRGRDTAIPPRK